MNIFSKSLFGFLSLCLIITSSSFCLELESSSLDRRLRSVDVGCLDHFPDAFKNTKNFKLYGLISDKSAYKRLKQDEHFFNKKRLYPLALSDHKGKSLIYFTKERSFISMHQPDPCLMEAHFPLKSL